MQHTTAVQQRRLLSSSPYFFFFFLVSLATAARPGLPVQHISFCSLLWPPRLPLTPTPSCCCCPAAAVSVSRGRRGRAQHNMYVPCRVRGSLAHPTPHPSLLPAGVCLVFFDPIECCCLAGRRTGPARSSPNPARVAAPRELLPASQSTASTVHPPTRQMAPPSQGSLAIHPVCTPSPRCCASSPVFHPPSRMVGAAAAAATAHSAGVSVAIFVSPPPSLSFAPLRFPTWKCLSQPQLQSPIPSHQRLSRCLSRAASGWHEQPGVPRPLPFCHPLPWCTHAPPQAWQCDHLRACACCFYPPFFSDCPYSTNGRRL